MILKWYSIIKSKWLSTKSFVPRRPVEHARVLSLIKTLHDLCSFSVHVLYSENVLTFADWKFKKKYFYCNTFTFQYSQKHVCCPLCLHIQYLQLAIVIIFFWYEHVWTCIFVYTWHKLIYAYIQICAHLLLWINIELCFQSLTCF